MKKNLLKNVYSLFLIIFAISLLTTSVNAQDYQKNIYSDWFNPLGNYSTYVSGGCGLTGSDACNGDGGLISKSINLADIDLTNFCTINEPILEVPSIISVSAKLTAAACAGDFAGFVYDHDAGLATVSTFPAVTLTAKYNGSDVASQTFSSFLELGLIENDDGHVEVTFLPSVDFDEVELTISIPAEFSLGGDYQFFHAFAAAPATAGNSYTISACGGVDLTLDVLANDMAQCIAALAPSTVAIVKGAEDGETTVIPDGTITDTPQGTPDDTDSFAYRVCDSSLSLNIAKHNSAFAVPSGYVSIDIGGPACAGFFINDEENAADLDTENTATLHMDVGLGIYQSVKAKLNGTASSGDCGGFVISNGKGLGDVSLLTNFTLRTYLASVEEESVNGSSSSNPLCVGCFVMDEEKIVDAELKKPAKVIMPLTVLGAGVDITADLNGVGAAGLSAGFVLDTDGSLFDLNAVNVFEITTYKGGISADNDGDNPDAPSAVWLGDFVTLKTSKYSDPGGDTPDDGLSDWHTGVEPNTTYDIGVSVNSNVPRKVHFGFWTDWDGDGTYEDFYADSLQTVTPFTQSEGKRLGIRGPPSSNRFAKS